MKKAFLWRELRYTLWFPVYMVIYLAMERLFPIAMYTTHTPLDAMIPFCEAFVVPYGLWYPLLIGIAVYLLRWDVPAYHRYMTFLAVSFFLSELIWFLYPNGHNLRPAVLPRENLFTALISLIHLADTSTNVFPSVHVVGSLGALLAVKDCPRLRIRHPKVCRGITVLVVLICLSTVFIKQHAILDVIFAFLLALAVALPVYYRSSNYRLVPKWA